METPLLQFYEIKIFTSTAWIYFCSQNNSKQASWSHTRLSLSPGTALSEFINNSGCARNIELGNPLSKILDSPLLFSRRPASQLSVNSGSE